MARRELIPSAVLASLAVRTLRKTLHDNEALTLQQSLQWAPSLQDLRSLAFC